MTVPPLRTGYAHLKVPQKPVNTKSRRPLSSIGTGPDKIREVHSRVLTALATQPRLASDPEV